MHDNQKLIKQLKRHEGAVRDQDGLHRAYRCTAGALTIGFGHNLDANPVPGVGKDSRLTEDQAERLLVADIRAFCLELDKAFPWWRKLDEARRGVMVNMAFNLGVAKLRAFTATLGAMQAGRFAEAARNILQNKRWHAQIGVRLDQLAEQIRSGVWQGV